MNQTPDQSNSPGSSSAAPPAAIAAPLPNPLLAMHERANAEAQDYGGTPIVATFGLPELEYAALHKTAGLMDLPQREILELTGKDRHSFLNNLITNEIWNKETKLGMVAGTGVYAFLLNRQGRILADLNVMELGERMLVELDGRLAAGIAKELEKYRFGEKVKIESAVGRLHQIGVYGPGAEGVLAEIVDAAETLNTLAAQAGFETRIFGTQAAVWRKDLVAGKGYQIVVDIEKAEGIWTGLMQRFGLGGAEGEEAGKLKAGGARRLLRQIGWAAFNASRIEAGTALFGIDFDTTFLPAETGMFERGVSVTKGCYVGQEIVARMYARGMSAKKIVGLKVADGALPLAPAKIYDAQHNEVGVVTSSTIAPVLSNAVICLGVLKKAFAEIGAKVTVPAEGAMREAQVVVTPFQRE